MLKFVIKNSIALMYFLYAEKTPVTSQFEHPSYKWGKGWGGCISTQCLENTQQVYSRRYVFFYISKFVFSVIIDMNEYNFLCCVFMF